MLLRWFRLLTLALVVCLAGATTYPVTGFAQPTPEERGALAPDYATWEDIAARAENALAEERASNVALEQLRAEIARWRSIFLDAQSINQSRIETIRDQINALGPAPEEGAEEPADIAARRAALNEQLAVLQAPRVAAEEAYRRAEGIIREIDQTLRERQADELMQLWPAPVNPVNWPAGLTALSDSALGLLNEVRRAWNDPARREQFSANLPIIAAYLIFALVLLVRGRAWMETLTLRLQQRASARGRQVYAVLVSLGQVLLPLAGVYALAQAIRATGLIGVVGEALVGALPLIGFIILSARWLALQVFPKTETAYCPFKLSPERRAEGRVHSAALGVLFAVEIVRRIAVVPTRDTEAANAVITFPMLAIAGLLVFRIGQLIRLHVANDLAEDDQLSYRNRLIGFIGHAAKIAGIAAPLMAAVGYVPAATALIYPSAISLALVGLLLVLQNLEGDIYALVTKSEDDARDSLIPVLIAFAMTIAALPLFALIWGARPSELWDLWERFRAGFAVGDTRISPTDFLTFVLVFIVGYTVTRLVQGALSVSVLPKTRLDPGGQKAVISGLGYVGFFLAGLVGITAAGLDLSSLAIMAGALSVGIGFGLQNIVSNFVSGIILLIERPITEGDWIEVGGIMGTVRAISVRSTIIETFDRTDVIVPNADLISGMVTNWTHGNLTGRTIIKVGVAYGSDTRKVERILREVAEAEPLVVLNPPPSVLFVGFGGDSLDFEIRAILRDVTFILSVNSEILHEINRRFAEEGIEIPFAQRDLWLRNPEALSGRGSKTPRTARENARAHMQRDDDTEGDSDQPPPVSNEQPQTEEGRE